MLAFICPRFYFWPLLNTSNFKEKNSLFTTYIGFNIAGQKVKSIFNNAYMHSTSAMNNLGYKYYYYPKNNCIHFISSGYYPADKHCNSSPEHIITVTCNASIYKRKMFKSVIWCLAIFWGRGVLLAFGCFFLFSFCPCSSF